MKKLKNMELSIVTGGCFCVLYIKKATKTINNQWTTETIEKNIEGIDTLYECGILCHTQFGCINYSCKTFTDKLHDIPSFASIKSGQSSYSDDEAQIAPVKIPSSITKTGSSLRGK